VSYTAGVSVSGSCISARQPPALWRAHGNPNQLRQAQLSNSTHKESALVGR
jgi:hypothetical protein